MKTYLYIDTYFKIEQKDVNPIASKIGGVENTSKKARANKARETVENNIMYLARLARKQERAARQKDKRRSKFAQRRKAKSTLSM